MRTDIQTKWADLWSSRWKDGAYRLRFELGEGYDPREQPIPRALQAFTRANAVADALLGDACIGVVATYRDEDGFAALQAMGLRGLVQSSWRTSLYDEEDGDAWHMRSFDLNGSSGDRDILLWNPIALELPISPSSPDRSFLLHPTEAILLHVYDDRGMDVIGKDAETLKPIYERFDSWLVGSDRPRMEQVFA